MGFKYVDWVNRISKRMDITSMLTHLTRPQEKFKDIKDESKINLESVKNLIKILKDKTLYGSSTESGFIVGNRKAVCFQDAPLYGIIQNVENEINNRKNSTNNKIRYSGNGLLFSKFYIYERNGRPVIYDKTEEVKSYLPENQYWRIVNFQLTVTPPKTIDWTHEREWRVPGDLEIDYDRTHVVLYDKDAYDYFIKNCDDEIKKQIHGITILKSILM